MLVKLSIRNDGRYTVVNVDEDKFDTLKDICSKSDIEVEELKDDGVQQAIENDR
jgi:hypothetical protein